jgi:hypothetical protein
MLTMKSNQAQRLHQDLLQLRRKIQALSRSKSRGKSHHQNRRPLMRMMRLQLGTPKKKS